MRNPVFLVTSFFCCLSALFVFDLIWVLLKTRLVYLFKDKTATRKIHQRAIPRAGGICIAVSFCAILCVWNFSSFPGFPRLSPLFFDVCLIVAIGIFIIGFFDDATSFAISNKAKFILEFVIAAEVVLLFGIQFPEINFFGVVALKNKLVLSLFSIFWMVGVANAFNIIDGIDGLAGTIACISFSAVAFLAMHAHAPDIAVLSVILAAGIVGFLFHNISPARVFLGDTGSLFLGMLLSMFLMYMVAQPREPLSINTAFLIAGFPIIDVAVAMGRRFFRAFFEGRGLFQSIRAITVADSEHTHHRLVYRGLSHTQATVIIATLSTTLCIAAIHINLFQEFKFALVVYMAVVVFWFIYELNFFDRIIVYIKFILHEKSGRLPHRIGVVDADPILHHALIRYRQRKFCFEFISHQDLESRDALQELQLEAVTTSNEQFFVTSTWAQDTRKFSREMIMSVIDQWAKSSSAGDAQNRKGVTRQKKAVDPEHSRESRPFTAMLINCRDAAELDHKLFVGRQLVREMQCAVIVVSDLIPHGSRFPKNILREMLFIKKPFYVPVFFKELHQLAQAGNPWRANSTFLNESVVLKKVAG
jgi:UDP-GlcNAc:undecaprenyl-phosphate/decaprenyl-phosphate GlcNAc-1-phosphate transferase